MMPRPGWQFALGFSLLALLIVAEATRPFLPGDPPFARLVQNALPAAPAWAEFVSGLASFPVAFLLLLLALGGGAWLFGWRGALAAVASFAGMVVLDRVLRLILFQPRPNASLIRVVGHTPGSAFPSTFALLFGATVGFLLLCGIMARRRLWWLAGGIALVVGFAARIALGAHWPSDVLVSYAAALLWGALLLCSMKSAASAERQSPAETTRA
jgi:membrane-associated phospholipid phosphatase